MENNDEKNVMALIMNSVRNNVKNSEQSLIKIVKQWEPIIDFNLLDQVLFYDRNYNFHTKLQYAKKYNRKDFLKDLIADIKLNYMHYDYDAILYVSLNCFKKEKKRSFYLLEAFAKVEEDNIADFLNIVNKNNAYEELKNALIQTLSTFLKIKASVYLNPDINTELFKDKFYLIDAIKNSKLSSKKKTRYFLDLNKNVSLSSEEIEYLEEELLKVSTSYEEKLKEQLATIGEELVDLNNILYAQDLKEQLEELNNSKTKGSSVKK